MFFAKKVRILHIFGTKMQLWKKKDTTHFYAGLCAFYRQMVLKPSGGKVF